MPRKKGDRIRKRDGKAVVKHNLYIPSDLLDRITEQAKAQNRTATVLIEEALESAFQKDTNMFDDLGNEEISAMKRRGLEFFSVRADVTLTGGELRIAVLREDGDDRLIAWTERKCIVQQVIETKKDFHHRIGEELS